MVIIGTRSEIREKIGESYFYPKPYEKKLVLRDILQNVPKSGCTTYNDKKREVLKHVSPGEIYQMILQGSI